MTTGTLRHFPRSALAALALAALTVSGCESLLARAPHDAASCACYQDSYAPSTTAIVGLKWPW